MAKIRLEDLTKTFGRVTAVKKLSFEAVNGEFFVLVGPNGCGKTTILRLIAGLTKADSGNIYIGDRLVNDVKPAERGVSMVFQARAHAVKDNIELVSWLYWLSTFRTFFSVRRQRLTAILAEYLPAN